MSEPMSFCAEQKTAITVLKMTFPARAGNLKAFASVRIKSVVVHDFRVVQQDGQKAWVSPPQREYSDATGARKFAPVIEFPADVLTAIGVVVLAKYREQAGHG